MFLQHSSTLGGKTKKPAERSAPKKRSSLGTLLTFKKNVTLPFRTIEKIRQHREKKTLWWTRRLSLWDYTMVYI